MRAWRVRGRAILPMAAAVTVLAVTGCQSDGNGPAATLGDVVAPGAPGPPAPPALPWEAVRYPAAATTSPATTSTARSTTSPAITPSAASPLAVGPCLPLYGPGTEVPVTVTTVRGQVVMTWWHNGDPAALAYWVGAFLTDPTPDPSTTTSGALSTTRSTPATSTPATSTPATSTPATTASRPRTAVPTAVPTASIRWFQVAPPSGCRAVSFTVPGLVRGLRYTLILDLQARTPETTTGISRVTVNQIAVTAP